MYKITPFLTTLALTLGCGAPVGTLDRAAGVNDDDPILYISEHAVFFDQVCEGTAGAVALTLGNVGGSPLVVQGLRLTGLGFSLRNRPALPLVLPAGALVNFAVQFTPGDSRIGSYEGNLLITSTDPLDPAFSVPIFGVSLPATLRVTPRQRDLGPIPNGGVRALNLALRADECPVNVRGARVSGNLAYTVSWDSSPSRIEAGQVELVHARVNCDGQDDIVEANLRFTDDAGLPVGSTQLLAYCDP